MTGAWALGVLLAASAASAQPATVAPAVERIVEIRVHGNHTTPDTQVVALAGVAAGAPVTPDLAATVTSRLRRTGRFRSVEVRKRFASLSDPAAVVLVIVVEEKAGVSADVPRPGPLRGVTAGLMWLPVLRVEDGYGFTYGARISVVEALGRGSRLSAPLTWGGERRAAAEWEHRFARGPVSRVEVVGGVARREHPGLDVPDRRTGVSARVERSLAPWARVGGTGTFVDVAFADLDDRLRTLGADLVVDTRTDPAFPRNAVHATVSIERLWFDAADDTVRTRAAVRGYVGLVGQSVLALSVQHGWSGDPLPIYEQAMLGGVSSLRGFPLGYRTGDRLMAGSAELRLPLTSPLSRVRTGVAFFADAGTVHGAGTTLADATWDRGAGAGVFVAAPLVSFRLDVARGIGGSTRAHVSFGLTL